MAEKTKNNKKPGMKSFLGGTILTDERVTKSITIFVFPCFFGIDSDYKPELVGTDYPAN